MSRSLKKGPYIDFKLEKKVDNLNKSNKKVDIFNKYISDKVISDVGSKNYLMKKFGPKR